jgi:hypothetical protein
MKLVHTGYGYDFYMGPDENSEMRYNIVPQGSAKPEGGYPHSEYIAAIKKVKNVFKTIEKEHAEIKQMIDDKLKQNGF